MAIALIVLIGASRQLWQTLSESRTELERRVQERTYALQLLNQALRNEISDRERAEEALRASEEQFRQIFMTTPIPVWLYDLQTGRFLEVNDIAVRNYGYSREEVLEMSIADIQPGEAELCVPSAGPRPGKLHGSGHCGQHRKKDGPVIDVEISSHAVTFARQSAMLMAALDISDRKQMEVELRHAQKLEAVGALAAGIAHEINTPIQFVGDNARFLQNAFGGLRQLLDRYEAIYEAVRNGSASDELVHAAELARIESDWEYSQTEIPKGSRARASGYRACRKNCTGDERIFTRESALGKKGGRPEPSCRKHLDSGQKRTQVRGRSRGCLYGFAPCDLPSRRFESGLSQSLD